MRKSLNTCLYFLMLIYAFSCSTSNEKSLNNSCASLFEIDNKNLKTAISQYILDNKIENKRKIITVDISQRDSIEIYIISNTNTNPFNFRNKPFAYSKLNETWIVFFNIKSNIFDSSKIKNNFMHDIKRDDVILKDKIMSYDPNSIMLKIEGNKKPEITNL